MEIESKHTGSSLTANEFNQIPDELENLITKSGLTPSSSDLTQLTKAVAQMVGDSDFYATSGTANAIVLSAVAPRLAPSSLSNGLRVRFKASYANTGAVTVNVNNLGAKYITVGGTNIGASKLEENKFYDLTYSTSTGTFELFESGAGSSYTPPLFSPLQSDHLINDIQWLRADTFSWQSGLVYTRAYQELLSEYNNASSIDEVEYNFSSPNFTKVGSPTIVNGVVSNFSSTDCIKYNSSNIPSSTNIEVIFKTNPNGFSQSHNVVFRPYAQNYAFGFHTNGKPSIYTGSWTHGNTSYTANQIVWLRLIWNGTSYKYYSLLDNNYTKDTLPELSNWTLEVTWNTTTNILSGGGFNIGQNDTSTSEFLSGSIDIKNSFIKVNNETWWQGYDSISYKRTPKGYKVANSTQEQAILSKYNSDGVAWYYILDTSGVQFKLPRTKWGLKGVRNSVGNDIDEKVPNIKGGDSDRIAVLSASTSTDTIIDGSLVSEFRFSTGYNPVSGSTIRNISFDASLSSSAYQDNAPVQERGTQMYLYFYIGNYEQSAINQTAGLNTELFNNKIDLNLQNLDTDNFSTTQNAYFSKLGMPSGRYVNLTLGASGSTYTAPANGWLFFSKTANSSSTSTSPRMVELAVSVKGYYTQCNGAYDFALTSFVPVEKDDVIYVRYTATGTTNYFKFIYAEGDET